ncbi:MAG: DUF4198 domain-containing protein [Methylococcales bacterium]|nr:DUF4198 domain-containing protein [Methylococcales bacterium]
MKYALGSALAVLVCGFGIQAHEVWIKPDAFELNSDEQKLFSVDVSRSALAYVAEANHQVKSLGLFSPQGEASTLMAAFSGETKEVFEVPFSESGTYKLTTPQTQVFLTFYRDGDGKRHKIRMPKSRYHELPEGASPIKTVEKQMTSETYISYNGFSQPNQKSEQGLTIVSSRHPNQLTVEHPIEFSVSYKNQSLVGAEVSLKSWNHLYDADLEEVETETDNNGRVRFEVTDPGRYLLIVEHSEKLSGDEQADSRSIEKFLSFDVTR